MTPGRVPGGRLAALAWLVALSWLPAMGPVGVSNAHAAETTPRATKAGSGPSATAATETYLRAYPQLKNPEAGVLAFPNGTTQALDDGRSFPTFDQLIDHADLLDQLSIHYPRGCPAAVPGLNDDPGRLRSEAFFRALYGNSAAQVQAKLRSVPWFGSTLQVTTINGVDTELAAVADELATMPELRKYLVNPGGGFLWRVIAGTKRLSGHSFGIAVDINVGYSDYWRWNGVGVAPKYRNRIPCAIASVFERHGFIWGAKWYHYDTMHFEYRPELLG